MEKMSCDCNTVHEEVVKAAQVNMLTEHEITELSTIFKVLGDPTRVKILWSLNEREMCVCDLAVTLGMTKSAISHQLKTLRDNRIVKSRRDGKNIFYSLDDRHITNIIDMAKLHISHSHDDCCGREIN